MKRYAIKVTGPVNDNSTFADCFGPTGRARIHSEHETIEDAVTEFRNSGYADCRYGNGEIFDQLEDCPVNIEA